MLTIPASAGAEKPGGASAASGGATVATGSVATTQGASAPASEATFIKSQRTPEDVNAAQAAQKPALDAIKFKGQKRAFTGSNGFKLNMVVTRPPKEVSGNKYPLVVLVGEPVGNVFALGEVQEKYPHYAVSMTSPDAQGGTSPAHPDWKLRYSTLIAEAIDKGLSDLSIDHTRIYVTGFSAMGGATLTFAMQHPRMVAAVVPIAATGDVERAGVLAKQNVAVWLIMGGEDHAVGVDNPRGARALFKAIVEAGGHPRYTEYVHLGHGRPCYSDSQTNREWKDFSALLEWMFAQKRAQYDTTTAP